MNKLGYMENSQDVQLELYVAFAIIFLIVVVVGLVGRGKRV